MSKGGKLERLLRFMVQCRAGFGLMDSEAVLGPCSVVLLRLAFECDRSLARFAFPTPSQPFFLVDPFVLDSLIELATRELDDVSASLDEDRWVKPSQFLKRIAQLTK